MTGWKTVILFTVAGIFCCGQAMAGAPLARKNEIKLFMTAAHTEQAIKALNLDENLAQKVFVCFFDTSDRTLRGQNLILRARQKGNGPGESTVKLRAIGDESGLSDAVLAIQPEQDWTNESEPTLSRSKNHKSLPAGMVESVAAGQVEASRLFSKKQRKLVADHLGDFNWSELRLYGPAEALVWRQHWKLDGFPEAVTVEVWHLQKEGETRDIMEVSVKVKAATEEQAQAMARQFFAATRAAGLGEPLGQTKTQMMLDFFQPGSVLKSGD